MLPMKFFDSFHQNSACGRRIEYMDLILLMLQDILDEYLAIQKEAKLLKPAQTLDGNRSPR